MKKILLIILIGVLLMLKPINAIIKDSLRNIIHRGSVVTGIIATDNGDGSYDVFISESDKAYPNIRTLSATPDLAVDDKVRILYKNGCKELPIILPPVVVTAVTDYVAVYYRPNASDRHLKIYDLSGNEISDFAVGTSSTVHQLVTVDSNGYIYLIENWNTLKKYDSSGNVIVSIAIQDTYAVDVSSDGYIYTLELSDTSGWDLKKRNTNDLSIASSINFGNGNVFNAFALDGDVFYVSDDAGNCIEKRNLSDGSLISSHAIDGSASSNILSIGLLSDDLYGGGGSSGWEGWYMPKTLDTDATAWVLSAGNLPYNLTVYNNRYIFISGWNGSNYVIRKYDSNRNLVWEKIIGGSEQYGTLSIGACSYK